MEVTHEKTLRLSPTAIKDFLTCPMLDYYKRKLRLEPVKTPIYFIVGRAFHAAMEKFDAGNSLLPALVAMNKEFDGVDFGPLKQGDIETLELERGKCEAMVTGYFRFYESERKDYLQVRPEQEVSFELLPNVIFYCRLDVSIHFRNGDKVIRERKTASRPSGDYYTRTKLDGQVLAQLYAYRHLYGELPSFLEYDVITKSALRPRVKDSRRSYVARLLEEYQKEADGKNLFVRHHVIPDEGRIATWLEETKRIARLIQKVRRDGIWWHNPNSCVSGFGSGCSFLPACDAGTANLPIYKEQEYRR